MFKARLLLDFNCKFEDPIDIESTPAPMHRLGWGYGGWYRARWGGGAEVRTRHYKVGTLLMDSVDHEKHQSVYQGGVEGIVSKEMLEDAQVSLTEAVARIREVSGLRWPVRARRACKKWTTMGRWPGGFGE